jgi:hypothetical protein
LESIGAGYTFAGHLPLLTLATVETTPAPAGSHIIRLGHKQVAGTMTLPMPSTLFITTADEEQGFRILINAENELLVTKFDHKTWRETISITPSTANQIIIK